MFFQLGFKIVDAGPEPAGKLLADLFLLGSSIPERVDGIFAGVDDDGNDGADEALPIGASAFDCDGDGYTGAAEDNVYSYVPQTDGDQKTCQEYDAAHANPNAAKRWITALSRGVRAGAPGR